MTATSAHRDIPLVLAAKGAIGFAGLFCFGAGAAWPTLFGASIAEPVHFALTGVGFLFGAVLGWREARTSDHPAGQRADETVGTPGSAVVR